MKKTLLTLSAIGAALTLGACATGYGGGHRMAGGYDAYYDDFYGPYTDGYWGADDVFMYSREGGGAMIRDEAHHFRHGGGRGFHGVHSAHAGGEHRPG